MTRSARTAFGGAAALAVLALGGCGLLGTPTATGTAAVPVTAAGPGPSPSTANAPATTAEAPTPSDAATTTIRTTTPSQTPTPTGTTTPTSSPTESTSASARTMLRDGDRGQDVLAVQKELSANGYWLGTPDGVFGDLTLQAVYAVQKAAGIGRDGVIGPRTRKAIDTGVRPTPTISGNGVEINIARQLLMVVRGGRLVYTVNTSTGSGQEYTSSYGTRAIATTPKGSFHVFRTVNGQDVGKLGVLWRPRYFNGGIAVHGSPSVPPYPASHGCARLSNPAIDMIWAKNLMPVGSRVVVS